ncbi:MAG: YjbQ family protein [Thermoleophilia bacterium]|nr:YjbQ family protein [Thermoleophilia bacterium]
MKQLEVISDRRNELIDITSDLQSVVDESGISNGLCHVYVPHTTAAVTINESADPAVRADIIMELDKVIPHSDNYTHLEGNSAAHIKASLVGCSETILVKGGRLVLGTWQAVYFCEFDGPRARLVILKVAEG